MPSQAPSTNVARYLDVGNIVVYYYGSTFSSFSSAVSSTAWRKLGVMKAGTQLDLAKSLLDVKSGTPLRLSKRFYTEETLKVSGELMEISPFNLSRALGGLSLTTTVLSSTPAATTVATGSTKSSVVVASSSGYTVGDLIRVGNSGAYQYGVIKTIVTNTFTFYEDLDGDANPTTGHAVAKVDKMSMNLGTVATPSNISLKLSKTIAGGYGTMDIYIINAVAEGNAAFNWADNGTVESVGIPFSFEAISDATVESGATAQVILTQS